MKNWASMTKLYKNLNKAVSAIPVEALNNVIFKKYPSSNRLVSSGFNPFSSLKAARGGVFCRIK